MANLLSGSQRQAKEHARRAYLQRRGVTDLPGLNDDPTPDQGIALRIVATQMTTRGLYSRHTDEADVRWGIRRHVTSLRGETTA